MTTLDEAFEQFKQLPDWDRFPMPDVFYKHFNLRKPQPAVSLMDCLTYTAPPHQSLNTHGKVEIREPVEGGVREITEFLTLPVEHTVITDQTADDTTQDSHQMMLSPPTEHNTTETQPSLDHLSPGPSCDGPDTVPDAPCRDAECSPSCPQPQSELS